ncbi:beta-lactamase family protein [Streptomyces pactum]|uniref:Beta-lactamase family protein n=1 Tax=Streptomyces pactum TaxID=68249 RepID=A0ABS0NPN9_9ACTN|nr:serine hydrolase domain-containing protein [Streptomyces pactum]MBH5337160.1 beta-lactamase family protein [Streptomyces pactum]
MTTTPRSSLTRRSLLGATAAGALLSATGPAAGLTAGRAAAAGRAAPGPPGARPGLDPGRLRAAVADLDHPPATAAQLQVSGSVGRWYGSSGVADLRSGRPVRPDDRVRIGSITKLFVATVLLQLVAEGRVHPGTPVQRCLPGLLPAGFAPITLTQLLNHTSGLPEGRGWPDMSTPERVFEHRFDRWTPEQLVATVTWAPELKFTPGTVQEYRGTNYVLAAMVIERLTGRPYGEEVAARLLRPLGLHGTSVPGDRRHIPGRHVHGYRRMSDGTLRDITVFDPSSSWGEGEMTSTTADLTRFTHALFRGELLPPELLRMMSTLPPGEVRMADGGPARYGAGLQTVEVNGFTFWGKTGEFEGYASFTFATLDLERCMVLSFNPERRDRSQELMSLRVAEAVTAGGPARRAPRAAAVRR